MKWIVDSYNRKCVVDGVIREYDISAKEGDPYEIWPPIVEGATYIGIGKIWSIDGIRHAETDDVFAFYRLNQ